MIKNNGKSKYKISHQLLIHLINFCLVLIMRPCARSFEKDKNTALMEFIVLVERKFISLNNCNKMWRSNKFHEREKVERT